MNTLTKNRILQSGDEYRDNGAWKPVPKEDFGLQVMFTKYAEVRRPKEEPPKNLSAVPVLAEPQRTPQESASATAERCGEARESTPVAHGTAAMPKAVDSRGGARPIIPLPDATVLPTVVSKKAHRRHLPMPPTGIRNITFPDKSTPWQWTGRNGTFNGKGIRLQVVEHPDEKDNVIQVRPIGVRGVGNALIEFPASVIPQVVDWLLRMQPAPTPK